MKKEKKMTPKRVEELALKRMAELDPASVEYRQIASNLNILREANSKPDGSKVSKDTVWKVTGYVGVAASLMLFETIAPLTSKVFSKINFPKLF